MPLCTAHRERNIFSVFYFTRDVLILVSIIFLISILPLLVFFCLIPPIDCWNRVFSEVSFVCIIFLFLTYFNNELFFLLLASSVCYRVLKHFRVFVESWNIFLKLLSCDWVAEFVKKSPQKYFSFSADCSSVLNDQCKNVSEYSVIFFWLFFL